MEFGSSVCRNPKDRGLLRRLLRIPEVLNPAARVVNAFCAVGLIVEFFILRDK